MKNGKKYTLFKQTEWYTSTHKKTATTTTEIHVEITKFQDVRAATNIKFTRASKAQAKTYRDECQIVTDEAE